MGSPTRAETLQLFRSFLRAARAFPDYNIREYTRRRAIDAFRQSKTLTDTSAVLAAFHHGKHQLDLAKRQSIVYFLYAPNHKSVMEIKH